ncbi:hypothetical protein EYR40_004841 [Pleurotus pulmonarius]|nr:hypothetical protein EYR38_006126 [Pleurotus pulmonarius]KAF4601642.1 hypothetical protein EYR40_004841 [Pleurotus pulmonarius]
MLLDAAERYQAKKKRNREERAAKRRRLMMPAIARDDNEDTNDNWYDVPETSQATSQDTTASDNHTPSEPVPSTRRGRPSRPTWKVLENQHARREKSARGAMPPRLDSATDTNEPDGLPATPPPPTIWSAFRSTLTHYGLYRDYPTKPTYDPYSSPLPDIPMNATTSEPESGFPPKLQDELANPYFPFSNSSLFGLLSWKWVGSNSKSDIEFGKLFSFLQSSEFHQADIVASNLDSETTKVDKYIEGNESLSTLNGNGTRSQPTRGGWKEVPVSISIPDGKLHPSLQDAPVFEVPGLHYRSLTEVIRSTIGNPDTGRYFHYTPYKQFFEHEVNIPDLPLDDHNTEPPPPPMCVYDEIYASDAMIDAHIELQQQQPEENCDLERVVAAIMLYSDSTHLASFGTASAWPVYLSFGNESKYVRCKPSTGSCHHIAYIPKLPDTFFEFVHTLTGEGPTTDLLTHARRELMHAVWRELLDNEFIHAYKHGIVIECADGIQRRFYPRLFTYSADYPEKVLLATIRNLGGCPCPRCLTPKDRIVDLGTQLDRQRRLKTRINDDDRRSRIARIRDWIYIEGRALKNKFIELTLGPKSEVATSNAFSERLPVPDFDYFNMFVPDLMHEIELGTWKGLFTHLIRILVAHGGPAIQQLNDSYRAIPTFGKSTIRRFADNVSSMKKLAARNFEDILQCAGPVFEGILPEPHDSNIQKLLFTFAEWHALAKLRMHTEETLSSLDHATSELGRQLRHFEKHTCAAFETKELPKEEAARGRRQSCKSSNGTLPTTKEKASGPKIKRFNLRTYKFHAMGDYVRTIRRFGTTDSYSTQPGELQHRRLKVFYIRTSKNKALRQMAKHEARERLVHVVNARLHRLSRLSEIRHRSPPQSQILAEASMPYTPPTNHHTVAKSVNSPRNIYSILAQHEGDPALVDFIPKLKQHLLSRLRHCDEYVEDEEFSREEWLKVQIAGDRIYLHKTLHVNYTAYNIRLGEDTMNPRTHPDIMTLKRNEADDHPFSYARILSVFHVKVHHDELSPIVQELDVLWTFDTDILDKNFRWPKQPEDNDYKHYYVNFFVDRDMFMRYHGGGIGHYKVRFPSVDDDTTPSDEEDTEVTEPEDCDSSDTEEELSESENDDDDDADADNWVDEEDALGYAAL